MPAISEGYSRRVQEKKENCINIYIYIYVKRTILEAIQFLVWFIARVRQEGRLYLIRKHTLKCAGPKMANIKKRLFVEILLKYLLKVFS